MARPKKEEEISKSRQVTVRLTDLEYEIIEKAASQAGMTFAGFMRHQAVHGTINLSYPIVADLSELKKLTNEFAAIGNNLNQIAKYFHMGGLQSKAMREKINSCIAEIMKMRKAVMSMAGDFYGSPQTPVE